MMATLEALPPVVRSLTDAESQWLRDIVGQETRPFRPCMTCGDAGTFRWYGDDGEPTDFDCDCAAQWKLHRFLLACGIGVLYQRYGWRDYVEDPEALELVTSYLDHAEGYISAGVGLVLYGNKGTGKSLLSVLMLKRLLAMGYPGFFCAYPRLLDWHMRSWRDPIEREWFDRMVTHRRILVIDDVGREHHVRRDTDNGRRANPMPVSQSALETLLRVRIANALPTFITTNLDIVELEQSYGPNTLSLLREQSSTHQFCGSDWRDNVRIRRQDEVERGLGRPVTLA